MKTIRQGARNKEQGASGPERGFLFIAHCSLFSCSRDRRGFSILEIALVVAITTILAIIIFTTLRPVEIAGDARNRQREADVNALLNFVYRNITDNNGTFTCGAGAVPTSTTNLGDNNPAVGDYNIADCLVPAYINTLPYDPSAAGAHFASTSDYDLKYSIMRSTTTNRITISAPSAENSKSVSVTR